MTKINVVSSFFVIFERRYNMSSCVLVTKDKKMDLTCLMRDADLVIRLMEEQEIGFEKKFTSLHGKDRPATITFNGIFAKTYGKNMTEMIANLVELCSRDTIGNVYISFREKNAQPEKPRPRFGPESAHEKHAQ